MQSGSFGLVLTEAPAHKQVPGTRVIVDGFRHTLARCPAPLYFLSHYHSDHYAGITENWNRGVILCSPITARLVATHLQVPARLIRALPMRQEIPVDDGLSVTLIEANHCPGAAMLIFKKKAVDATHIYLHSGDMRYADWMAQDPLLLKCKGAAALYLDTTYCNPRYKFPPQSEAVAYVAATVRDIMAAQGLLGGGTGAQASASTAADASARQGGGSSQRLRREGLRSGSAHLVEKEEVRAESGEGREDSQGKRTLFLISTYVIGKEKVLQAVAKECCCQVYVDQRKLEYLKCLELDYLSIFTTDPSATPVHVTSWGMLGEVWPYFRPSWKTVGEYLEAHPQFDSCVGFVPTGWSYEYKKKGISVRSQGPLSIHLVPYSEHSSFAELQAMVSLLKPLRIVPTVGVDAADSEKAATGMLKHLTGLLDQTARKSEFLKGFWKKGQPIPQDVAADSGHLPGKQAQDGCQLPEQGICGAQERGSRDADTEACGVTEVQPCTGGVGSRGGTGGTTLSDCGGTDGGGMDDGGGSEKDGDRQEELDNGAADVAMDSVGEVRAGIASSAQQAEALASLEAILGGELVSAQVVALLERSDWDVARAVARHFDGHDAAESLRPATLPPHATHTGGNGDGSGGHQLPSGLCEGLVELGDDSRVLDSALGDERRGAIAGLGGHHGGTDPQGYPAGGGHGSNAASCHSPPLAAAHVSPAPGTGKNAAAGSEEKGSSKKPKLSTAGLKSASALAGAAGGGGKSKTPSKGQQLTMLSFFSRASSTQEAGTVTPALVSPAPALTSCKVPAGTHGLLVRGAGDDETAQRPLASSPEVARKQPSRQGREERGRLVARRLEQEGGEGGPVQDTGTAGDAGLRGAVFSGVGSAELQLEQGRDASVADGGEGMGNVARLEVRGGIVGGKVRPDVGEGGGEGEGHGTMMAARVLVDDVQARPIREQEAALPLSQQDDDVEAAPTGPMEVDAAGIVTWDECDIAGEEEEDDGAGSAGSGEDEREMDDEMGEDGGKGGDGGGGDHDEMGAFGGNQGRGVKRRRNWPGGSKRDSKKDGASVGKGRAGKADKGWLPGGMPSGDGALLSPLLLPLQSYDPLAHAGWAVGQPAPYQALARAFELLESDRGRLRMANIFTNLFRSLMLLAPADVLPAVYLCTNQIAPDFMNVQLSIGGALVAAAVSDVTGVPRARLRSLYAELGDMGDVALACKGRQRLLRPLPPLTISDFYGMLVRISKEGGEGTVQRKKLLMQGVMRACREREIRYVVRTLLQHLRVGAVLKTILPAVTRAAVLTHAAAGAAAAPTTTPTAAAATSGPEEKVLGASRMVPAPARGSPLSSRVAGFVPVTEPQMQDAVQTVMEAFATCPSLDVMIPVLIQPPPLGGVARVPALCSMRPGVPVKPMLAKAADGVLSVMEEFGSSPFLCEYKYDGQRAQIHLEPSGRVSVFSRNLADSTERFPDVVALAKAAVNGPGGARSFVIDAEIVGVRRCKQNNNKMDRGGGWTGEDGDGDMGTRRDPIVPGGGAGAVPRGDGSEQKPKGQNNREGEVAEECRDGPGDEAMGECDKEGDDEAKKGRDTEGNGGDDDLSGKNGGKHSGRVAAEQASASPPGTPGEGSKHKGKGSGRDGGSSGRKRFYYGGDDVAGGTGGQACGTMELIPFQELSTRGRVEVALADVTVDVCVFVFDLLYLDGQPLLKQTLRQRRSLLPSAFPSMRQQFFEMARCVVVEGFPRGSGSISAASGDGLNLVAARRGKGAHLGDVRLEGVALVAETVAGEGHGAPGREREFREEKRDRCQSPFVQEKNQRGDQHGAANAGGGVGGDVHVGAGADTAAEGDPEVVVRSFFHQALACGCEGIVAKALDDGASSYEPARRCSHWLKLKKDYVPASDHDPHLSHGMSDTLDLVPIGAWWGSGRKAGWFSPFLCAVYEPETEEFQSLCRVMSGFSDAFYKEATAFYKEHTVPSRKPYIRTGERPAVWFEPCQVWEIRGADLTLSPVHQAAHGIVHESRGIGMRFPRFIRPRPDKAPEDATTAEIVADMYRKQL